jgi:hypothetical protein
MNPLDGMFIHVTKWDAPSQSWQFWGSWEPDLPDEAVDWPQDRLSAHAEFDIARNCDDDDAPFGVYCYKVEALEAAVDRPHGAPTKRTIVTGTHVRKPLYR